MEAIYLFRKRKIRSEFIQSVILFVVNKKNYVMKLISRINIYIVSQNGQTFIDSWIRNE